MTLYFHKKSNQDLALPRNIDWAFTSGKDFGEECTLPKDLSINGHFVQYGIYHKAFYGEDVLKTLIIPSSIRYIGVEAFSRSSISSIRFHANYPPVIASSAFNNCSTELKIEIPLGAKANFYTQDWIIACGGEDKWQEMIIEGDYKITTTELEPLYCFDTANDITITITGDEIEKVGLMPFLTWNEWIHDDISSDRLQISSNQMSFNNDIYKYWQPTLAQVLVIPEDQDNLSYDLGSKSYVWSFGLDQNMAGNQFYITNLDQLEQLNTIPLLNDMYEQWHEELSFIYPQITESIYIGFNLNNKDTWSKLASLKGDWGRMAWETVECLQIDIPNNANGLYIIIYEEAAGFQTSDGNIHTAISNKFHGLQFELLRPIDKILKSNSCYNTHQNGLYVNSPRIEALAFQSAHIDKLIIGPNVTYIAPNAFLNATIGSIEADSASLYKVLYDSSTQQDKLYAGTDTTNPIITSLIKN